MRRLALAIALACALSGVARAGEIHSTGAVSTPPPSTATATTVETLTADAIARQDSSTLMTIILTLIDIVR